MLKIKNLSKSYTDKNVINDLSVEIHPGDFYGILGPNGSGKSTLIKIIAGLITDFKGEVSIFSQSYPSFEQNINKDIGYISDSMEIHLLIKTRELLPIYRSLYTNWNEELFNFFVSEFGIDLTKKFIDYSSGQKMQFLSAVTLASQVKLVLLDEITGVLDSRVRGILMDYLKIFTTEKKGAVMMATNLANDIQGFAHKIIFLQHNGVSNIENVSKFADEYVKIRTNEKISNNIYVKIFIDDEGASTYIAKSNLVDENLLQYRDKRKVTIEDVYRYKASNEYKTSGVQK